MSEISEVEQDLAAFADEESDVAIDQDGSFIIQRHGREMAGQLVRRDGGDLMVSINDTMVPYRRFLTHDLARLDVLAARLLERRVPVPSFVNAQVKLQRASEDVSTDAALEVLHRQCSDLSPFASRVTFITADAGHGKTALLREHQHAQAERFIAGRSHYLFWHLDLQGRQLLRLSEALMGDLADLRLSGLWMPAVVRLMRRGFLVIGIDGFDELAAEQGGADALGALASLVSQLRGQGAVVAASRRTFFDTDDYLRRGGMVRRGVPDPCQFDQVELSPWTRADVVSYLRQSEFEGSRIPRPEQTYDEIRDALGGDTEHPLITRPFLVTQISRAVLLYGVTPAQFVQKPDDPYAGVAAVVEAFVQREVADKWKIRETGEPLLSEAQHLQLLADVAEEMHRNQKDRLPLDIVETITTLLLDQWSVDSGIRQQVIEMVRMHVLLVPPRDGSAQHRSFDHPEFRDYFVAYALRSRIDSVLRGESASDLARFLSISQLSDSTARYVVSMIERTESSVHRFLGSIESLLEREWKPTYLQVNLGTLIPFMLSGIAFQSPATFRGRVIYSSVALEKTDFSNVYLAEGTLLNASLRGIQWRDVILENFELGEVQLDRSVQVSRVKLTRCTIDGIRLQEDEFEESREYSPRRIAQVLDQIGFESVDETVRSSDDPIEDSATTKLLRKLLRNFGRTTILSDDQLKVRFGGDFSELESDLVPYLVESGVLRERKWKGAGNHSAWSLAVNIDDFLAAEGTDSEFGRVWTELS